jgi:CRISPR-associated endoribonuclease Cas6
MFAGRLQKSQHMRIKLKLTPNTQKFPFNYQHELTGVVHKWLGQNDLHGQISLMSYGWLRGGKAVQGGLDFPFGAEWFISFWNEQAAKTMLAGLLKYPDTCYGMRVSEAALMETPAFGNLHLFNASSPVLTRKNINDRERQELFYTEPEATETLTRTLMTRLETAGLESKGVRVAFDRNNQRAKTKMITYKGNHHRVSLCPVWVEGTPDQIAFAWHVGIGELTGSGFGGVE